MINYDLQYDLFSRIVIDPTTPNSLSNDWINALYLNNNGILWIGTAWSGIDKIDTRGNPFKHIQLKSEDEELFYSASSFFMDKKGNLWVGACTGGVFKFDPRLEKVAQYQYNAEKGFFIDAGTPFTNWVDFIYGDSDDILWIGLGGWGPAIFDRKRESFIFLDFNLPEGHPRPERIQDIFEDHTGTIWIATWGSGLFKKEKTDGKYDPVNIVHHEILMNAIILDIFEDSNGNLWFSTAEDGLFCLKAKERETMQFTQYGSTESGSPGLYTNYIEKVFEDIYGTIWVGSFRGLYKYNPAIEHFELIHDSTGLFGDGIGEVFGDDKGNLWLSHYRKGLIRYKPESRVLKIYDTEDGLPFDNFVSKYWYQSEDGRIFLPGYLGAGKGFFYFHPDSIHDNTKIPPIVVSDFKVEGKPFSLDSNISAIQHITLKYDQNFFSFEFAALDYANPNKNQYAYYLEGLDEDWIYSGNRRFASYTSVPPGNYIFHVKGSNNDGYWNEEGASLAITVLPPPWRTWWAYTIYALVFIGLIYLWRQYDLKRQHLKQALEIEHVEAEKLKELDSMKSRFFANISHEFRTPLTLILGPLEKIKASVSEEVKHDLEMMQRNARRLQRLINQLLSLSKLESGQMKLQARELNLVKLVIGYIQSFESLAKQKNIDLVFQAEEKDIQAYIDQEKLEKILFNLLSNAFKFTPEGGRITIEVGSGQLAVGNSLFTTHHSPLTNSPSHHLVTITITDTGPGISPDQQSRIFDRFYQADDSYTKDQEGTGIGLALTKELVELHHGEITVESEIGKGTTFTIILPLGKEHLKPEEIISAPPPTPPQQGRGVSSIQDPASSIEQPIYPTPDPSPIASLSLAREGSKPPSGGLGVASEQPVILIVEDNPDMRNYIRGHLGEGYRLIEAGNGEEGLEMALEGIPDLVISDVMMPKMDGFELCEKLKSDERTCHIPVILLTARASEESKIQGLKTGADDYLYKPFNYHELIVRVNNLIEQRKRIQEQLIKQLGLLTKPGSTKPGIRIASMDEQFMAKAIGIVEDHMSDPDFSIDTFGKLVGMSRSQLHRKLTALVNLSPTAFVRSLRLSRAASLISRKSGTISEIAFEVGFNNLSYFARSFREQFGVLPSEYTDTQNKN